MQLFLKLFGQFKKIEYFCNQLTQTNNKMINHGIIIVSHLEVAITVLTTPGA